MPSWLIFIPVGGPQAHVKLRMTVKVITVTFVITSAARDLLLRAGIGRFLAPNPGAGNDNS